MSSKMGESGRPPGNASVHDNRNKIKCDGDGQKSRVKGSLTLGR
jgi:hypothetical protein